MLASKCIPIEIERECLCTKCRSENTLEFVKGDRSRAVTAQQVSSRFIRRREIFERNNYKPVEPLVHVAVQHRHSPSLSRVTRRDPQGRGNGWSQDRRRAVPVQATETYADVTYTSKNLKAIR